MSVLKKPVVTEKYTKLSETLGQYAFLADKKASKDEIRREIEKVYDVNVTNIRTMIYAGKRKTRYTKKKFVEGRTPAYKKAVVTLQQGQTIDFYGEGI
jgi:large subunit ribosomal protein L23